MKQRVEISKQYLRTETNFSLAPKGQEVDIEPGKCNYYTDRKEGATPAYILQTFSVASFNDTIAKMTVPDSANANISELRASGVSVHYVIDTDGTTYQLVPEDKRPWAAGVGSLKTGSKLNPSIDGDMKNSMNDFGISIMSINDGKSEFTEAQVAANIALTQHLIDSHKIAAHNVIGLSDWAPERHIAPGPYFPWKAMSESIDGILYAKDFEFKSSPEIVLDYTQKPASEDVDSFQAKIKELEDKLSVFGFNYASTSQEEAAASKGMISAFLSFNLHHLGHHNLYASDNSGYVTTYSALHGGDDASRAILGSVDQNTEGLLNHFLDDFTW